MCKSKTGKGSLGGKSKKNVFQNFEHLSSDEIFENETCLSV